MPDLTPQPLTVTCNTCGATAETWDCSNPDDAVRCTSPAGEPPGSVDGCCSTLGHAHEEHVAHVAATGDASSRPITISATAHLTGEVTGG